ncbi:unnamed protein product [Zymoseptoria tritici ST99CH_1A5]|uniref:CRIB domain-containing protein n=4 Tax=Zymoseptoria tritici TaxID=1047171 RepID=F9XH73_ZYMTI|nr:uncharacterized protein MYCGRDRAFT_95064 [Zymoseptoria tritici IPO323]EGP85419.1 hypothetical protein MYCGRDRAFT_95064 [Zymoseptoria tritici IPO323]SMQ53248.1 unnamed protein product [Zymoseptoria tritici ST99CH_3D7]SMR56828.1 unnamed protein product [Zymoseptoria tritici ST99CH_1E4]SMY26876.1 unnamed protein product [Zymoseptoria tritici ST99CH_1A5]
MTPPRPSELYNGSMSSMNLRAHEMDSSSSIARPQTSDKPLKSSLEHQRKRLSFFGRTPSDASSIKHAAPSLTSATSQTSRLGSRPLSQSTTHSANDRPTTGISQTQSQRSGGDPIQAIRNTLFGFRRRKAARETTQGPQRQATFPEPPPSRQREEETAATQHADLVPFAASSTSAAKSIKPKDTQFKNEDEFYQHRKKTSISRPFNFQHVTHTARKHLPHLHTVHERDLPGKFWALNAYQKPKENLKGIKVEDLSEPVSAQPGEEKYGLPALPLANAAETDDETTFDETQETNFNPDTFDTIHGMKSDQGLPLKHYSSMSALGSITQTNPDQLRHFIKERATDDDSAPPTAHRATTSPIVANVRASMPVQPAPPPETLTQTPPMEQTTDQEQARALTPPQQPRASPSKTSLRSSRQLGSLFSSTQAGASSDYAGSIRSKRSSRSTATAGTRMSRMTDLAEPTWEDVVDLAFEQEAEATCDFDWENTSAVEGDLSNQPSPNEGESPSGASGGVSLSGWLDRPVAPNAVSPADSTSRSIQSVASDVSQPAAHKRGQSVGHRGFLDARSRSASTDGFLKEPQVIESAGASSSTDSPAPTAPNPLKVFLTAAECEKSPYTAEEMHFPTYDLRALLADESLSDPEDNGSSRSSSGRSLRYRRKSSDTTGSLHTASASDMTRWSSASTSSIPDLMHSFRARPEGRKSSRMSRSMLPSLPQSPIDDVQQTIEFPASENSIESPIDPNAGMKSTIDEKVDNAAQTDSATSSEPSLTPDSETAPDANSENGSTVGAVTPPCEDTDLTPLALPDAKFSLPPTPPPKTGPLPPLPPPERSLPTLPERPLTTSVSRPTRPLSRPPLLPGPPSRYRTLMPPRSKSYAAGEWAAQNHKPRPMTSALPAGFDGSPEILMRRPETSGDRELLFSAGRMVQRGRSATPPSRVALGPVKGPEEEDGGWI